LYEEKKLCQDNVVLCGNKDGCKSSPKFIKEYDEGGIDLA
jgi:hypothetical protein